MIVSIDGLAGTGKGTLAKELARLYRMKYLDTGTLYRTVAHLVLENKLDPYHEPDCVRMAEQGMEAFDFKHIGNNEFATFINDENVSRDIRRPAVNEIVAMIADYPTVRAALKMFQVDFAELWSSRIGVIMDGRDIGSVICPHAEVKLCLDASPKVRAERRQKELASKGFDETLENCLAEVHKRDSVDESRIKALLDMDDKVVYIDTSDMNVAEVLNAAIDAIGHDKLKVAI